MYTFGSDPEIILREDKQFISCHSAEIKGSKDRPYDLGDNIHVHRDNALLEFSVPVSTNAGGWVAHHKMALRKIKKALPPKVRLSSYSSAEFNSDELWHPESMTFGCEPDVSCWDPSAPKHVDATEVGNFRVAGGHIHIGYGGYDKEINALMAKWCDVFLGLPSVLMDPDRRRRKIYGSAGSYRDKPYGMEYRVLSNFWIFDERLLRWAFRGALNAAKMGGSMQSSHFNEREHLIERAINTYDAELAAVLCSEFNSEVVYV